MIADVSTHLQAEVKLQGIIDLCFTFCRLICIDQLRDELSCAICLEVAVRPTTTACGESMRTLVTITFMPIRHGIMEISRAQ